MISNITREGRSLVVGRWSLAVGCGEESGEDGEVGAVREIVAIEEEDEGLSLEMREEKPERVEVGGVREIRVVGEMIEEGAAARELVLGWRELEMKK